MRIRCGNRRPSGGRRHFAMACSIGGQAQRMPTSVGAKSVVAAHLITASSRDVTDRLQDSPSNSSSGGADSESGTEPARRLTEPSPR